MSHSKHHYLALVPLLSLLAMSPAKFETKSISRGLASVVEKEVEKPFPKYEELLGKIDRSQAQPAQELTSAEFDKKVVELKAKIKGSKSTHTGHESLVLDLLTLEKEATILKDKSRVADLSTALLQTKIIDLKATIEDSLKAIPEVVKEEPKKEEVALEVKEEKKVEKKEEVKSSENAEICALQEENKLLSKQVEELLGDQKKISDSLVNITSTLAQLVQRQMNPWAQYMSGPMPGLTYSQAFPVPQQMGGQWVYMTNPQQMYGNPQFQVPSFQELPHMQSLQQQSSMQMQQNQQMSQNQFGFSAEYAPFQQTSSFYPTGNFGQSAGINSTSMFNFSVM